MVTCVPNGGNPSARLFILGEAPGAKEEREGKPFVGDAGDLLFELLGEIGLSRADIFLANAVRFRPTKLTAHGKKDRRPTVKEVDTDGREFERDIARVRPRVVLTLGVTAARALRLDVSGGIGRLRGRVINRGDVKVVPTFHPGYLLSNRLAEAPFRQFRQDLRTCARLLGRP